MPKSVYAVAVGWCRGQGEGDFFRTQPYSQANFGDDHSIFDSGFVLSLANALVEAMLSGADVELPAVPGAGDDVSAQRAFTERATGVRTDTVKHMQDSINIEDGKDSTIRHNFRTVARRNGCDLDQGDCCHGLLLLLLQRFCHKFGIAQDAHHVAAQNFMDRFLVVAAIQKFLSDQRIRCNAFQLFGKSWHPIIV